MSELVGYVRKSKNNGALKVNISVDAFNDAARYQSQDGHEYVALVVNLAKVQDIINNEREVTSVCHIKGE